MSSSWVVPSLPVASLRCVGSPPSFPPPRLCYLLILCVGVLSSGALPWLTLPPSSHLSLEPSFIFMEPWSVWVWKEPPWLLSCGHSLAVNSWVPILTLGKEVWWLVNGGAVCLLRGVFLGHFFQRSPHSSPAKSPPHNLFAFFSALTTDIPKPCPCSSLYHSFPHHIRCYNPTCFLKASAYIITFSMKVFLISSARRALPFFELTQHSGSLLGY